jgi:hypothetical protein
MTNKKSYMKKWRAAHPHASRDWMRTHRSGGKRRIILGVRVDWRYLEAKRA